MAATARSSNQQISRMTVEHALVFLQLECGVLLRLTRSRAETLSLVDYFTVAIARRADEASQSTSLQLAVAGRQAKAVGKDMIGLREVWKAQLQQFLRITEPRADAIATTFPSPQSLVQAFSTRGRHAVSGLVVPNSNRKIGDATSELLYSFFMATDPEAII